MTPNNGRSQALTHLAIGFRILVVPFTVDVETREEYLGAHPRFLAACLAIRLATPFIIYVALFGHWIVAGLMCAFAVAFYAYLRKVLREDSANEPESGDDDPADRPEGGAAEV